jgi:hypothetical protein
VFNAAGERGRKDADALRTVADAMLDVASPRVSDATCRSRSDPGPGSARSSVAVAQRHVGTSAHAAARGADGRAEKTPSIAGHRHPLGPRCVQRRSHFHDGGPYDRAKGAERGIAVDVTGLRVCAPVVSVSTHENPASDLVLDHLRRLGSPSGSNWPWSAMEATRPRPDTPPVPRRRAAPARVGRQAADVPPHPTRLVSKGRPRPPWRRPVGWRSRSRTHHLSYRPATGGLHRDRPRHLSRTRLDRRVLATAA